MSSPVPVLSPEVARKFGAGELISIERLASAQVVVYDTTERSIQVFADPDQNRPIDIGPYAPTDKLRAVAQDAFQLILILIELLSGWEFTRVEHPHGGHIYKRTELPYHGRHHY